MDIFENNLYIGEIISVLSGKNHRKTFYINGRKSDGLVFILSGKCRYTVASGRVLTVKKGDILYLSQKERYEMAVLSDDYEYIFCDFRFVGEEQRLSAAFSVGEESEVRAIFEKMLAIYKKGGNNFFELVTLLYKAYQHFCKAAHAEYIAPHPRLLAQRGKKIFDENYADENLTVEKVAQTLLISSAYLRKLFKSCYGISPLDYLIKVRVERAKTMMEYPFISFSDCAARCGFSTQQYFSRVFKKVVGVSPSLFRSQIKSN